MSTEGTGLKFSSLFLSFFFLLKLSLFLLQGFTGAKASENTGSMLFYYQGWVWTEQVAERLKLGMAFLCNTCASDHPVCEMWPYLLSLGSGAMRSQRPLWWRMNILHSPLKSQDWICYFGYSKTLLYLIEKKQQHVIATLAVLTSVSKIPPVSFQWT